MAPIGRRNGTGCGSLQDIGACEDKLVLYWIVGLYQASVRILYHTAIKASYRHHFWSLLWHPIAA
jgi:hypothetical protein